MTKNIILRKKSQRNLHPIHMYVVTLLTYIKGRNPTAKGLGI